MAHTRVTSVASLVSLQKIGAVWHVFERLTEMSALTLYHVITEHLLSTVLPLVSPFTGVQGWCNQRLGAISYRVQPLCGPRGVVYLPPPLQPRNKDAHLPASA